MIPLSYFLLAWLAFLLIFLVVAAISILQMLRFGLAHWLTEAATAFFVLIAAVVILGTLGYLSGVDLKSSLDVNALIGIGRQTLTSPAL